MNKLFAKIRQHLPQRRRRFWRYVSPRRQGIGLALLAILLGLFYGYWYLTNDGRIRRMAEKFLRDSTGGVVSVQSAEFHLFSGVELRGVRIYTPDGSSSMPGLQAPSLILRHDPWRLLATGQLHPTQVIFNRTIVNVLYLPDGTTIWQRIFNARQDQPAQPEQPQQQQEVVMPPVQFRNGTLRFWRKVGSREVKDLELPLEVTATRTHGSVYKIVFPHGQGLLDVSSGELIKKDFRFPEGLPLRTLPPHYREILEKYQIAKGSYRLTSQPNGRMLILPENASMKLPAEQGGLSFTQVSGKILLDPEANLIKLTNVQGRLPEAGSARVVLNGTYGGDPDRALEDPGCPCDVQMRFEQVQLPPPQIATGPVRKLLEQIHGLLNPSGQFTASGRVYRESGGKVELLDGKIELDRMQIAYREFPYPIDDLTGTIEFDLTGLGSLDLWAQNRRLHLSGEVENLPEGMALEVDLTGREIAFDQRLYKSLPKELAELWENLQPRGRANVHLEVRKPAAEKVPDVVLTLTFTGQAGLTYHGFPYPLENMTGRVRYVNGDIHLIGLESYHKGRRVGTINGSVTNAQDEDWQLKLAIVVDHMPIDQRLIDALGPKSRQVVASLHPEGLIDSAKVSVYQDRETDLDFKVLADLAGARILYEEFPYELTDIDGSLSIYPDRVVLEPGPDGKGLAGRHGEGLARVRGQILFGPPGIVDLQIQARDVQLDKQLHQALPEGVQEVWTMLGLAGQTDLSLQLKGPDPENQDRPFDYHLVLLPTDLSVRWEDFPLPVQGVKGRIVARPGLVDLERLTVEEGNRSIQMVGKIRTTPGRREGRLKVIARNVPIDKEFIQAVPEKIFPFAKRLKPRGTCTAELKELHFVSEDIQTEQAASEPPDAEAKARQDARGPNQQAETGDRQSPDDRDDPEPETRVRWSTTGMFRVEAAAVDIGMLVEQITGNFTGSIASGPDGAALAGKLDLASMAVGDRKLTQLTAGLEKHRQGQIVLLEDLSAKAHGGKVAGFAEIKLAKQVEYGVSLEVDRIDLDSLVNAGIQDPKKRADIQGKMAGRLSLIASGPMAKWKAEGQVRITKAKLYKLPVMLGLLHVVYLTLPTDSAFTEAQTNYELRRGKLVLNEILLNGNALSLLGSGNMKLADESLRLTFVAGPPGKMPSIGAVSEEILELIAKELMVIEVRGTVDRPRVQTVPLKGLKNILDALLAPSRDAGS
jgi:hypothetical protein